MRKILAALLLTALPVMASAAVEPGKTYRIVPDANSRASLFVKNAARMPDTPVVVWTETQVPAQQWTVLALDDGSMALRNVYTGGYLSTKDNLLVQTDLPAPWTLEPVDEEENVYNLAQESYLGVTATIDGQQPRLGNGSVWHFVEVEPLPQFNEAARQRMLDAFLEHYLQDKGQGYRTFVNGGWNEAETLEAVLDCYEATGDRRFLAVFEGCYNYMRYHVGANWDGGTSVAGYDWYGYDFNDDVMWMIIAAARAYLLTGKMSYLNDAKRNFDLIWDRAYLGYVGLLRWAEHTGDRNGANSCINGPAEVAACYIALGSGDATYFERARELYANQRSYLFEPYTGKVYDSVVFNPDDVTVKDRNTWASTYNQGTMLGAALLLYRHFGDEQYKTDASRIIAYAKTALCNSDGIVRVCQNADGDFQGFKGILMRYAGLYACQFDDPEYQDWLIDNAFHAFNNVNSQGYGHSAWLTKAAENGFFGSVDYTKPGSAFGATTALSAACAVPLQQRVGVPVVYEAEEAQRTGSAAVQTDPNTGGKYVSGLDNGNGMLRFNCEVAEGGEYLLDVYFLSFQSRNLQISIGNKKYTLTCPSVSTWDNIADEGKATLKVQLTGGAFACILTNPNGAAPHIDKIAFSKVLEPQAVKTVLDRDGAMEWGTESVSWQCEVPQAGHYRADVFYTATENRTVYVAANDAEAVPTVFGASEGAMERRPLFLTLQQGANSLLFSANPALPEMKRVELSFLAPVPEMLEAEFAATTGQVSIARDADASGGRLLTHIGNGPDNMASYRVDVPVGGRYELLVTYCTAQNRQMYVRVNNGAKQNAAFESTGGWTAATAMTKRLEVTLKAGTNLIALGCDTGWAPYVDKLQLAFIGDDGISQRTLAPAQQQAWCSIAGFRAGTPRLPGVYVSKNSKIVIR